jgi:alpha/beta superfamily hydrolase
LSAFSPRAQSLQVDGPAGGLEVLLEEPEAPREQAFAVVCHPHPLFGGTMQNKVVHTLARACNAFGIPSLRFNFRGVGSSRGSYDEGRGEVQDTLAVIAAGRARWPGAELILGGFSFGAMVSLNAAAQAAPAKLISIAPAVGRVEFTAARRPDCPWLIVQGDADELVDIRDVRAFAARWSPPPRLVVFAGGEHFFHGRLVELRDQVRAFLENSEAR